MEGKCQCAGGGGGGGAAVIKRGGRERKVNDDYLINHYVGWFCGDFSNYDIASPMCAYSKQWDRFIRNLATDDFTKNNTKEKSSNFSGGFFHFLAVRVNRYFCTPH